MKIPKEKSSRNGRIDFDLIKANARPITPALLQRWLPGGRFVGNEYLARNPHRNDRHAGSFSINVKTGRWCDFATGDKGGDIISLAAFIFGVSQIEAAKRLADLLSMREDH